jgi:hypothetical protein
MFIGTGARLAAEARHTTWLVSARVGDSGLALDGLDGNGLAAFDQDADRLLGGFRRGLGLRFRCCGEGLGALGAGVGHGQPFR